jgi:putative Holliday junction resolvase
MNILAIDFGQRRTGLAWCNSALGVVLPFGLLRHTSSDELLTQLCSLITEERIDEIVLGLPLPVENMNPDTAPNVLRVKSFGDQLAQQANKPVHYVDERFSSAQADRMGGDISRDEKSAMIILEGYMAKRD